MGTEIQPTRNRKSRGEMLPFVCNIHHRVTRKGKIVGGLVAPRCLLGTWVGKTWSYNEQVVAAETGEVLRASYVEELSKIAG